MTNEPIITISNDEITIQIKRHGAELSSIRACDTEYLWQADPAFWKRHSPVLFPIVGSLCQGCYRVDGQVFKLSQHGFARDLDFECISQTDDQVWYRLESNASTKEKYPYDFILEIGYKLIGKSIEVQWRVKNPSDKVLDFQIGAHPAFYYRPNEGSVKGYFSFDMTHGLRYKLIGEKSCVDVAHSYPTALTEDGLLEINAHTFDRDALIFEDSQIKEVTLHDAQKNPYLKLKFTTPLVGLWAPSAASPFVCIEPWYGRCDRMNYNGEFKERDWMQHLDAGKTFEGGYTIEIL